MNRMEIVKRESVNLERDKCKDINMYNTIKLLRTNSKETIFKVQ